jgi:hypothetical protein
LLCCLAGCAGAFRCHLHASDSRATEIRALAHGNSPCQKFNRGIWVQRYYIQFLCFLIYNAPKGALPAFDLINIA